MAALYDRSYLDMGLLLRRGIIRNHASARAMQRVANVDRHDVTTDLRRTKVILARGTREALVVAPKPFTPNCSRGRARPPRGGYAHYRIATDVIAAIRCGIA